MVYCDPFHTGSSTGNFPGFFDFWYCRTNSVRSESFSDSAAGENPYCRFCTFAKLIFATSQTCRIIPQISPFLPSEKAQLVSLAEIAISLQIKRPIGRHRSVRTVRSIQIFPVGSIQIFEICDKCVQKISWNQKVVKNRLALMHTLPLQIPDSNFPVWNGSEGGLNFFFTECAGKWKPSTTDFDTYHLSK